MSGYDVWLIIASLIGLNVYQSWHWSRVHTKLVDKIMSRNYAEFVQTEHLAKSLPEKSQTQDHRGFQVQDPHLDQLNEMLGGV